MKCVICQHLKRCSVVMMRLLFLSEELGQGCSATEKGLRSNGGLLGGVKGQKDQVPLPGVRER